MTTIFLKIMIGYMFINIMKSILYLLRKRLSSEFSISLAECTVARLRAHGRRVGPTSGSFRSACRSGGYDQHPAWPGNSTPGLGTSHSFHGEAENISVRVMIYWSMKGIVKSCSRIAMAWKWSVHRVIILLERACLHNRILRD